jgi:CRP/FNR family transcriptional regulator, cyclic AMP receptor protein
LRRYYKDQILPPPATYDWNLPLPSLEVTQELRDEFLTRAVMISAKRGQIIVTAGASSNDLYLITEGRVNVSLPSPGGRETIVREIRANQVFGELSAIDYQPRSADVVAIENSQLAVLSAAKFIEMVSDVPQASLWLAQHLSAQIRLLTSRIFELSTLAAGSRLHCELLRLAIASGAADDKATITGAPTHADFAARIGSNRETVTRELRLLNDEGVLEQSGRTLMIKSVSKLGSLVRASAGIE